MTDKIIIIEDEISKISDEQYKELGRRLEKSESSKTQCSRCGECCKVLPLSVSGMPPGYRKYLLQRGLKEDQGFILIPHVCQHLHQDMTDWRYDRKGRLMSFPSVTRYTCAIHDSPERSLVCRKFNGQKRIGPWRVYVPPNCAFNKEK